MSKNEGLESLQCSKCGHAYSSDSQIVITPVKFNLQQFKNGQIKPFNGSLVGHSHLECCAVVKCLTESPPMKQSQQDREKMDELIKLISSEWALKILVKDEKMKNLLKKLNII